MERDSAGSGYGVGDCVQFQRVDLAADGIVAAHVRREFGSWLKRHFILDEQRWNDVLLAVNEALANAADYAYSPEVDRGTVDVNAELGADGDALTVTVADHGRWREPAPQNSRRHGRGIPLMRALADVTSIDGTSTGTRVTMVWHNVVHSQSA